MLVHGAYPDGSSWDAVILRLQAAGLHVTAVQNPLTAVSKLDQTISADLERFLAKRMHAQTVELEAGHLSLVSHPKEVADLILTAAGHGH